MIDRKTIYARFGQNTRVEISYDEYTSIIKAMDVALEIMSLEEKYDNLLENYQDLEETLLSIASRYAIFRYSNYQILAEQRSTISRKVLNLLSTGRQYGDQSIHFISNIFGRRSEEYKQANEMRDDLKAGCWQYEFIDRLRNHVQHFGLPIHEITVGTKVIQRKPLKIYDTVAVFVQLEELEKDRDYEKHFKPLIANIQLFKEKIDLMPLIKKYLECLGALHMKFRVLLRDIQTHSTQMIEETLREHQQATKTEHPPNHLLVGQLDEKFELLIERTIFTDPIERLALLQKKNSGLQRLSNSFVSSESPQDLKSLD